MSIQIAPSILSADFCNLERDLKAIANGETGPVQVTGVFNIAKLSTDNMAQGALLYWDNTNSRLTTTASGNTLAGFAAAAAAATTTSVNIKINA